MGFLNQIGKSVRITASKETLEQSRLTANFAAYFEKACGLPVTVVTDVTDTPSLVVGEEVRTLFPEAAKACRNAKDCVFGEIGDRCVLYARDMFAFSVGALLLAKAIREGKGRLRLKTVNAAELGKDDFYRAAADFTVKVFGTYRCWTDKWFADNASEEDKADRKLIEALNRRMGNTAAVCLDSPLMLCRGKISKLAPTDFRKTAKRTDGGDWLVPADGFRECFDCDPETDGDGYFNLTDYCRTHTFRTYEDRKNRILTVTPEGEQGFSDCPDQLYGYTDREYLDRMEGFFHNPKLPEPDNNAESTRRCIISNMPDRSLIYDYTVEEFRCYASPAILCKDGVLYVSYDTMINTAPNHRNTAGIADTYFIKSTDGGDSWQQIGKITEMTFAGLVELNGKIYLMGKRGSTKGSVVVGVYDPAEDSFRVGDLGIVVMGTAPTAIAIHNGRIYRAHNNAVISASVDADLLNGASWTVSETPNRLWSREEYSRIIGEAVTGQYWFEEGNVVEGKDGKLYAIYRIDASPSYGRVVILEVSEDGKKLTPVKNPACIVDGLMEFPCNQTKFMIKYDRKTDCYLSMTSIPTDNYAHQRNMLALVASKDLFHWQILGSLLVERQMMNMKYSARQHAFQYVDFDFDGDDLDFIVRESYGTSMNYHNSNAITWYRLEQYEDYVRQHLR